MQVAALTRLDDLDRMHLRDFRGIVSDRLARIVVPELCKAFPNGCRIISGTIEERTYDGDVTEIIVRLEVEPGEAMPDAPTLRAGLRKLAEALPDTR